jgi:Flp pilus assembly protein TadG
MLRRLRRLLRDESGATMVFVAAMLPVLFGVAALGVDFAQAVMTRTELQAGADAAAMAGVARLPAKTAAVNQALAYGAENLPPARHGAAIIASEVQIGSWDDDANVFTPGVSTPTNAVRVTARRSVARGNPLRTIFAGAIGIAPLDIRVDAVARMDTASRACILALAPGASRAILISGSGSVNLIGCNLMANSTAADAIFQKDASSGVRAPCLIAVGGIQDAGHVTLTRCSQYVTSSPAASDPFAELPQPANTGPCLNGNRAALTPGRYCNGLDLKGATTLASGTYVISGGTLRINSNSTITGAGVTFFLTDGAKVQYNGSATVNLTAPVAGPYAGILMFGARNNAAEASFNGGAATRLTGALYFPAGTVIYSGNLAGANGCLQIVAQTITWTGSSTFVGDCSMYGMSDIPTPGSFVLVQ